MKGYTMELKDEHTTHLDLVGLCPEVFIFSK